LGNPGPEYARTRHNVGWWAVDHLADAWHFGTWKRDGDAHVVAGTVAGSRVHLVRPTTYMNLSGSVLGPYLRRPSWTAASDLLVIADDVALPVGSFRLRARGSAGGHNGLKDIERALGSQEYARLRIGIRPNDPSHLAGPLADFVLDRFETRDEEAIRALLPGIAEVAEAWITEGVQIAMTRHNAKGKGQRRHDAQ
jgi:peptidyl-tRNA hydrolase, PTH1 family